LAGRKPSEQTMADNKLNILLYTLDKSVTFNELLSCCFF